MNPRELGKPFSVRKKQKQRLTKMLSRGRSEAGESLPEKG